LNVSFSGTQCGNFVASLEVHDMSNLRNEADGMRDLTRLFENYGGAKALGKYLDMHTTRRVVEFLTTYYGLSLACIIRNSQKDGYDNGHIFVHNTLFMNALRYVSPEQGVMLDMVTTL
jgi:hypothetical protein